MNTGRKRDISRPVEHMRPEELGIGELFGRIREAVTAQDARGYFDHCGYRSMGQLL